MSVHEISKSNSIEDGASVAEDQIFSDEIKEDGEVCAICLDGEVYDDNEIIFCDKCNVAVHQLCYGIKTIPVGAWFCFVCQEGLDPSALSCELCSYTGGAYKRCSKGNKWAHPQCASWIPEVYEVALPGNKAALNLDRLDMKRYKLKCGLCNKKGACVQCSYGRCTQGMHPWCALRNPQCTRRIIKGEGDVLLWEIFCKAHASAVSEAPKHRTKAKASRVHEDNDVDDLAYWSVDQVSGEEKESGRDFSNMNYYDDNVFAKTVNLMITDLVSHELSKNMTNVGNESTSRHMINLLEWPGIVEGEAMDLDHFWNYVSSFYVEDHSETWVEANLDVVKNPKPANFEAESTVLKAQGEELEELVEESLASLGGERDKAAALNPDKRFQLLNRVAELTRFLKSGGEIADQAAENDDPQQQQTVLRTVSTFPWHENEVYISETKQESGGVRDPGSIYVAFDGEKRFGCKFRLTARPAPEKLRDQTDFLTEEIKQQIIPPPKVDSSVDVQGDLDLETVQEISKDDPLELVTCFIRPRDEINELSAVILQDLKAYNMLTSALAAKAESLLEKSKLLDITGKLQVSKLEWKDINSKYMNQQIWKKIALASAKGNHDQGEDFSKIPDEVLPPSWTIQVEGRPKVSSKDEEEEDEEVQEDGLCMCCFDGTSSENNRIVFCDGCNASMHQVCYGIAEIPEGDYFCDRCKFLSKLALTLDDVDIEGSLVRETVKCCLCPNQHGGIKLTTDGRWVHVCCALWAKESEIVDLKDMSPINIGQVNFVPIPGPNERRRNLQPSGDVCTFCRQSGGYLVSCSYTSQDNFSLNEGEMFCCPQKFHPLCGWFAGCFIHATISDESFEARNREGRYPSGLEYCFRCLPHSDLERQHTTSQSQKQLRNKYKMNDADLEQIPGRIKKRRKNGKPRKSQGGGRKTASSSSAPKELPVDTYDDSKCACCLRPISEDIFGNGYERSKMRSLPEFREDNDLEGEPSYFDPSVTDLSQPSSFKCSNCNIILHKGCFEEFQKSPLPESNTAWLCYVCKESDYSNVNCTLCPRRGGYLCHTIDGTWAHSFCAKNIPAQLKITLEKRIDVRLISKENKKQKCSVCNRKGGICIQCSAVGCVCFFHPLCAARSNRGFVRTRNGIKEAFCNEHIPMGAEFLKSGYWIDGHELYRFRYCLDRSRLVLDMLVKREKLKKTLCKTETDLFQQKVTKLLDRAKGRKSTYTAVTASGEESDHGNHSEDDEEEEESEEDLLLEDDEESIDDEIYDEYVPLDYLYERQKKKKGGDSSSSVSQMKPPPMTDFPIVTDETVPISHTWLKAVSSFKKSSISALPEIKPLKKLMKVYFAGVEIEERDIHVEGGLKTFLKHNKDIISSVEDRLRHTTQIFLNRTKEEQFGNELGPYLFKLSKGNDKEFKTQVEKLDPNMFISLDNFKFVKRPAVVKEEKKSVKAQNKANVKGKGKKPFVQGSRRSSRVRGDDSEGEEDEDLDSEFDANEMEVDDDEDDESDDDNVKVRTKKRRKSQLEDSDDSNSDGDDDDEDEDAPLTKKARKSLNGTTSATKKKPEKKDRYRPSAELLENSYVKELISQFPGLQESLNLNDNNNNNHNNNSVSVPVRRSSSRLQGMNPSMNEEMPSFDYYLSNLFHKTDEKLPEEFNLMEYESFNENNLFELERILQDILNCISFYILPDSEDYDKLMNLSIEDYLTTIYSQQIYLQREQQKNLLLLQQTAGDLSEENSNRGNKNGRKKKIIKQEIPSTPMKEQSTTTPSASAKQSTNQKKRKFKETIDEDVPSSEIKKQQQQGLSPKRLTDSPPPLENGRYLCADFEEIPYDLLPNYDDFVRRPISLNIMKEKLHHHYYFSMASFSFDFYTLLSNARGVTSPSSVTWKDVRFLAKIFEESKELFARSSLMQILSQGTHFSEVDTSLEVIPVSNKNGNNVRSNRKKSNSSAVHASGKKRKEEASEAVDGLLNDSLLSSFSDQVFCCYFCKNNFEVKSWPSGMRIPDQSDSSSATALSEEKGLQTPGRFIPVKVEEDHPQEDEGIKSTMTTAEKKQRRGKGGRNTPIQTPTQVKQESNSVEEVEGIEDVSRKLLINEEGKESDNPAEVVKSTPSSRAMTPQFEPKITRSSLRGTIKVPIKEETEDDLLNELPTKVAAPPVMKWVWICPSCTVDRGVELLGREVQVWWNDDYCAYSGQVNAFDAMSDCHRVLYQDSEWEFVELSRETYLIAFPEGN